MDVNSIDAARRDLTEALQRAAKSLGMDLVRTGCDAEYAAQDINAAVHRSAHRIADDVRETASDQRHRLATALQERPFATLGAATGLGLLLGLIFYRPR